MAVASTFEAMVQPLLPNSTWSDTSAQQLCLQRGHLMDGGSKWWRSWRRKCVFLSMCQTHPELSPEWATGQESVLSRAHRSVFYQHSTSVYLHEVSPDEKKSSSSFPSITSVVFIIKTSLSSSNQDHVDSRHYLVSSGCTGSNICPSLHKFTETQLWKPILWFYHLHHLETLNKQNGVDVVSVRQLSYLPSLNFIDHWEFYNFVI